MPASRPVSILHSAAWNYLGYFAEFLAGVLLLAYIVRRVSVAEYGIFLLGMSLSGLVYLLDFGLSNVLVQSYVATECASGRLEVSRLVSATTLALAGVGAAGALFFGGIALFLPGPFDISPRYVHEAATVLILLAISAQITLAATPIDNLYQAFHRYDRINQIQVATVFLRVSLTIVLLARGGGIIALAWTQLITSAVRVAALWLVLPVSVPGVRFTFGYGGWLHLRKVWRASRWAFLDDLSRQAARSSDSIILASVGPVSSVALFGVGSKLPNLLWTVVNRGLAVVLPSMSNEHVRRDEEQLGRIYANAFRICFTGLLPLVVFGMMCARPLLVWWAGEGYGAAAPVMCWLLLAMFSLALEHSSDLLLYSRGQVPTAARIAILEAVANIALSVALVFRYGAAGLAAGTAISHLVISLTWYTPTACKQVNLPYRRLWSGALSGSGILMVFLLASAAAMAGVWQFLSPWTRIGAGVLCGIIYAGLWANQIALPMWRGQPVFPMVEGVQPIELK